MNIVDSKSDTVYQLIPFAGQNSGRLSDVSSVIKDNLQISESIKNARAKGSPGNMNLKR